MFGAAAMSLSSVCVVSNALRLNRFRPHQRCADNPTAAAKEKTEHLKDQNTKEIEPMEKTLYIEGMMCTHCSGHVKKALEAIDGVEEAVVSHETGTAVVRMRVAVEDDVLKKAVEDAGYVVK